MADPLIGVRVADAALLAALKSTGLADRDAAGSAALVAEFRKRLKREAVRASTGTGGGAEPQPKRKEPPGHGATPPADASGPAPPPPQPAAPATATPATNGSHAGHASAAAAADSPAPRRRRGVETAPAPTLLAACALVLEATMSHGSAGPFLDPVDAAQFPTYATIIPEPQCFAWVAEKLARSLAAERGDPGLPPTVPGAAGVYRTPAEFVADASRVFANCARFSPDPKAPVRLLSRAVREAFELRCDAAGLLPAPHAGERAAEGPGAAS